MRLALRARLRARTFPGVALCTWGERGRGVHDVLVCPVGFVADHLEIRWDLDTEAKDKARELGLEFGRIEMPNAELRFVAVLAALVRRALAVPSKV